jgi:hypothetical protein
MILGGVDVFEADLLWFRVGAYGSFAFELVLVSVTKVLFALDVITEEFHLFEGGVGFE